MTIETIATDLSKIETPKHDVVKTYIPESGDEVLFFDPGTLKEVGTVVTVEQREKGKGGVIRVLISGKAKTFNLFPDKDTRLQPVPKRLFFGKGNGIGIKVS